MGFQTDFFGTEENVNQAKVFYVPIIVRLGTSNNKHVTYCHRPRLPACHMQGASAEDNYHLAKFMRVQREGFLRFFPHD
jgi:hypothetical protein